MYVFDKNNARQKNELPFFILILRKYTADTEI